MESLEAELVRVMLFELKDRKGFDEWLGSIDVVTQAELQDTLRTKVREVLGYRCVK